MILMNLAACFLHMNNIQFGSFKSVIKCKFRKARANTLNLNRRGAETSSGRDPTQTLRTRSALPCSQSESLHWRNLALAYNSTSFFFADHGSTKIRNFSIDLLEGALEERVRWREIFLEFAYVFLRAFDLIGRQPAKNS